ncbi:methionine aminopeptidase 1A-like [Miscanthus floridulus]|uniref:methionine aminopeptidase 1A-like n=1 Tax=Miscanthus floridulus TaxID=154761 RepID=UPI00345A7D29
MEKGAPEVSPPCARCGKSAQLQCTYRFIISLPRKSTTGATCTHDCFRAAWSSHKSVHPKPGALASQQSPEGWKYCVRKGRGRALKLPRFDWTGPLIPYPISKMRVVPDEIEKPNWALDGIPKIEPDSDLQKRVEIKTPELIERMRETCRIAREVLDAAAHVIKPGITTDEIDRVVHEETIARGGYPSPLNYHFFPKSCCMYASNSSWFSISLNASLSEVCCCCNMGTRQNIKHDAAPSIHYLRCLLTNHAGLQCEEVVVDLDLLGDEIRADGGLLLDAELVDVTAHTKPRNRSPISTKN